jgi:hypothetical protein
VGPLDITIKSYGNPFFLPRLAALWEFQAGYRWHGFTGERIEDWDSDWLVVGAAETRNRKPLDQPAPFEASWELRCGPDNRFRVFYDVDAESQTVLVLAIGVNERNRLLIGGEEYES